MGLDIDTVMFRSRRFKAYDMRPVDEYLEDAKIHLVALEIAVRAGTALPNPLPRAHFPHSRLAEGYAIDQVDAFIDDVVAEIRRLLGAPRLATFAPQDWRPGPPSTLGTAERSFKPGRHAGPR